MKKLWPIILVILGILLIAGGIYMYTSQEKAPMHPAEVEKIAETPTPPEPTPTTPEIRDTAPEELETPEPELAPIGNRVEGTEPTPEVKDVPEPKNEDAIVINLLEDKTMEQKEDLTVPLGTVMRFVNQDSWPHQIVVDTNAASQFDRVRIWPGERLEAGEETEYTFSEKGEFLVRDIFSGKMRIIVTVE